MVERFIFLQTKYSPDSVVDKSLQCGYFFIAAHSCPQLLRLDLSGMRAKDAGMKRLAKACNKLQVNDNLLQDYWMLFMSLTGSSLGETHFLCCLPLNKTLSGA